MKNKFRDNIHITTPILSTVVLLLILLSKKIDTALVSRDSEHITVILLEFIIFALPCIIFSRFFTHSSSNLLKIAPLKADKVLLIIPAALVMIGGSLLYSVLISSFEDPSYTFTLYDAFSVKKSTSLSGILYLIFTYALIPAVFEEFTFRGLISSSYESASPVYSVMMSSLFFAMIHPDIKYFPFYLFSGLVLGLSLYATRSIFATIIIHFLYNVFFIFMPDYVAAIYNADQNFFVFVSGIVFFIALVFFCGEGMRIYKKRAAAEPVKELERTSGVSVLDILLSPTAVVNYLIYFVAVFFR